VDSHDKIPTSLLEKNPNLPLIESALDAYAAGLPVDQVWPETGEMLVVQNDSELGMLIVRAGNKIVYRSRRSVPPKSKRNDNTD